jgi:hypothetical protein
MALVVAGSNVIVLENIDCSTCGKVSVHPEYITNGIESQRHRENAVYLASPVC